MGTMAFKDHQEKDVLEVVSLSLKTLEDLKSDFPEKPCNMELKSVFYEKKDHTNRLNELEQIKNEGELILLDCVFGKEDEKGGFSFGQFWAFCQFWGMD